MARISEARSMVAFSLGNEAGADGFAAHDALQQPGGAAIGDDGGNLRFDRAFDGLQFGRHAAGGKTTLGGAGEMEDFVDVFDERDRLAAAVRLAGETLGAGQDNEQIGVGEDGDFGGKTVVVAEAQFLHGHHVVFVDDGNDGAALFEQAVQACFARWRSRGGCRGRGG